MLNWAVRYLPIITALEKLRPATVLEVGSGSQGLARYAGRTIVGVDITFSPPLHPALVPVRASALALPFPDDSFEAVVSSDMLEHVPHDGRAAAIYELLRVARRFVVLAYPVGAGAMDDDAQLAQRLARLRRPRPAWLEEHLATGHPTRDEVAALLDERATIRSRQSISNRRVHRNLLFAEAIPGIGHVVRRGDMRTARALASLMQRGEGYRELLVLER